MRPRDGRSCSDLAQGTTCNVSLKPGWTPGEDSRRGQVLSHFRGTLFSGSLISQAQGQSCSEWDIHVGGHGDFWIWKQQGISGGPAQSLGRLQRPAVGSTFDLASHASLGPESLALEVASGEPARARLPPYPGPAPGHGEQGSSGCTCQQSPPTASEVPLRPEPPSNLEDAPLLPRLASFPRAEGTKGKPATPGTALPEPAQTLHMCPSSRRTRYYITVTLLGHRQAPGEEGEEPAQPAPPPCGPEESEGWWEPPQGPRPITGCRTAPPQEPQLRAQSHQGSTAQQQKLQAGWTPGSPRRLELDHSGTRTPPDRLPGPHMEEAGGPTAQAKARVVSATLTWRQRPPAQEEIKHGFHKVSLVSGAQMEVPQKEMFEFSRREEVNGFATQEEETVNCQGPRDTAGSKNFQSHGPIFSKKYIPPPKEKRPEGRLKEAVDQSDGSRQAPRTEPPRVGAMARTELLVPLPGPREPSPHPGVGLTSGSSRSLEEYRVTCTVRTATVVGGHVDRRVSSSVTVRPVSSGEALPRGRQVARMVPPVVVGSPPGSPSRSQAVKVLSNLVPAGHSPPASHLPRPTADRPRSTGLGSTVRAALRQLPETRTAQLKDSSALASTGIPASAPLPKNQDALAACPDRDQGRAPDARACELQQVLGAPSSTELPLQTSQGQASVPSSPRLQTHVPSPGLTHPAKQPVVPTHPRAQLTPFVLPPIKREGLVDPPAATVLPMVRSEHVTVPGQPPAPSSTRRKDVPSPGGLSAPSSPRNKFVQNSENVPVLPFAQREVVRGPGAPAALSPTPKEVVKGPGAPAASSPTRKEVVQGSSAPAASSPTWKEVVKGPSAPAASSSTQEVVQGSSAPAASSPIQKEVVKGPSAPDASFPTWKEVVKGPDAPAASSPTQKEVVQGSGAPAALSTAPKEVVKGPGAPAASSPTQKEVVKGPGAPAASSSTQKEVVQGSSAPAASSPTQKEVVKGPGAPAASSPTQKEVVQGSGAPAALSPKSTEVVQGPEGSTSIQKEAVQGIAGSLAPPLTKEETVQGPTAPATSLPKQDKGVQDSEGSPISSLTQKEVVQDPAALPAPSSSVDRVSPSPGGTPAPVPTGAEASTESQLVSDPTEGKTCPETSREEDEVALAADLEIFLDTLRSMEPPEILRTHRLPRAPRSSYLSMYATLPAIEEDQPGPWVLGPGPQEVPSLEEKEEEEEEPENPYLSDDEKLQRRQEKAGPSPSRDLHPARPTQVSCSPLEMMKKHVAGTKGPHSELGLELQGGSRPTSRLGGSLLFGSLVPATKEASTPEPLGTKLSALQPHGAPGLRKVPGQLPLLCSERPSPTEKLACSLPLEGWSPALKTQGKPNTRPGKVIFFSESGCQGSGREVWGDIVDASGWAPVASIRVVRGCWVLYEEPEFRGQKLVLPEGDVELRTPGTKWSPQGIGSLRRVVWDYSTPEISLFSEEGLKGEQVKLTEALKNSQGLEKPLQVASATVSAGLWLLYPKPLFEDTPYILEPGEYPTSEAWGTSDPSVGSLKPMRLGCPSVEKPGEPRAVVYEAPGFQGRSWEVSRDIYNLQQPEDSQSPHLASVGSLRVLGGCWVGYEKEGFRGHQYLLEEGEYPDWSHWGGYDELLTSLRVIRTDFGDPAVVLFEAMDFEGHGVEVSKALPDVELVQHGPSTQAIHVLSGVWVAYQEVGFSGEQYVLEKGVYRNCEDWGAGNSALASLQPVLQVGEHDLHFVSKIQLFSRPDFLGEHFSFEDDQVALPASFRPQSCRVHGGSWILFDEKNFEGDQHILSEGEFPTLTAMGCLASTVLGSLQKVSLHFSEPSIFLYGLECFEGKEIELSREVRSLQAEGFNNHVLSVRIKGGVWVLCEHSDFRGRQWLVGSCEITNWLTYSGTQRVGSLYPIKQRRVYFRLWNAALGGFLAVPDHVEDMKAGRVVVSDPRAGGSCIWYYEDGMLKNQMAPTMSLQVIGPPSSGSKVVLWAESRLPRQTWSISESGHICSQMFEGQILDVKGGRGYDRDHVVLWEPDEDRASQIWTIHVL
ncbi:beta/gamma crystallin domain-containing protein 2 isoform X3 [Pongo abelii]|uniref:beta/gamma crystallin domain-containing protein 2 isoform X3 n=1 Tax=Pongo abelii TaxID=9601 RepID=UPI0023E7FA09|nr:beta/gamma crystallin domain-containing protein 2 isoform X3 [Pongo abelii]